MSNEDLARRAVACKGWRWMPGMKTLAGWRVIAVPLPDMVGLYCPGYHDYTLHPREVVKHCREPDLSDPATLGCLLALVREAWDDRYVYLEPTDRDTPGWVVMMGWLPETATVCSDGITEAAALVAALEASPRATREGE